MWVKTNSEWSLLVIYAKLDTQSVCSSTFLITFCPSILSISAFSLSLMWSGHLRGVSMNGTASSLSLSMAVPLKLPIVSNWFGYNCVRSSMLLIVGTLWLMWSTLTVTMFSCLHVGKLITAGPVSSKTYWILLVINIYGEFTNAYDLFYAVTVVLLGCSWGSCWGYICIRVHIGNVFPDAPVLIFNFKQCLPLGLLGKLILSVVNASLRWWFMASKHLLLTVME